MCEERNAVIIIGNIKNTNNMDIENNERIVIIKLVLTNQYNNNTIIYKFDSDCVPRPAAVSEGHGIVNYKYQLRLMDIFKGSLYADLSKLNIDNKECIPLTIIDFIKNKVGSHVNVYHALRNSEADTLFIKILEFETLYPDILYAFDIYKKQFIKNRLFLSNHQCYYNKFEKDVESEFKFNLLTNIKPYYLASRVYNDIKMEKVKGFTLEYKDEFQKWDYDNYIYDIYGPSDDRGYISFIKLTNGMYNVKRKIYTEDAFSRTEIITKNVTISDSMEKYLMENYDFKFKFLGKFRRSRYDVNIECLKSGNIHGIFFDYITTDIIESPSNLSQCEIEYLRTRAIASNNTYIKELEILKKYVINLLNSECVEFTETFYSKLSFMKDCNLIN